MFLLNSGAVLWSSKKQPIVSLSATSCACHAVWLKGCWKSCQNQDKSTIIHYDSSSTIKLSKNPVMHCGTSDPLADVMTKPLKLDAFLKT